MPLVYRKKRLFQPNPEVAREIARLDAQRDCQRIVYLLSAYDYSWDFTRALELALFYTYGSAPISRLLDTTGEFREHGQKRYDDTQLLIAYIMYYGWESEMGQRVFARVNKTHGHYRIAQDDFIFTLWTFIAFPIRWASQWSARPLTPHEQSAWFNFWIEVGRRLNIQGIPQTPVAYEAWVGNYKRKAFTPDPASARVAEATIRIIEGWLPRALHGHASPVIYSLFDDDPDFLAAIGAPVPPPYLRPVVEGVIRSIAAIKRHVVVGEYPVRPETSHNRTYGRAPYDIEALAPERIKQAERRRSPS